MLQSFVLPSLLALPGIAVPHAVPGPRHAAWGGLPGLLCALVAWLSIAWTWALAAPATGTVFTVDAASAAREVVLALVFLATAAQFGATAVEPDRSLAPSRP